MSDNATMEMPFMASLPRRERKAVSSGWQRLGEMKELAESEKGMPVLVVIAAELLGISRQRVYQIINDGRLEKVEWHGRVYVTEESLIEFAKSERKAGRPVAADRMKTMDCLRLACKVAKSES